MGSSINMAKEEWYNSEGQPMSELFPNQKCSICKKPIKNQVTCSKNGWHWFGSGFMCKKCAKKCPICKEYFCPKHINKHNCFDLK
jgi:hypothetical protein